MRLRFCPTIAASLIAIAIVVQHGPAWARGEPPEPAAAPSQADIDAAIARAKAAAKAGDYPTALAEFERARDLQPSAQLHFNVAVCHHALMLAAKDGSPERDAERSAAVTAYRAYLDAAPAADDRADVEHIIVELGGETSPDTGGPEPGWDSPALPELREIVTRIDPDPDPVPVAPPPDEVPKQPPPPVAKAHGRVGPFVPVVLAHMGRIDGNSRMANAPMIGLGVRGGVFLGARERINLGGEISAYGMPVAPDRRHTLVGALLGATFEYGDAVGKRKRFVIAGGLIIGPAFESLRYHGDGTNKAVCSVDRNGEVSARAGAVLGPRLALMVLLGRRRKHELGLRITPALALFGGGSSTAPSGSACAQTPFEEVGLPGGAALVTTIDLGYAPRL